MRLRSLAAAWAAAFLVACAARPDPRFQDALGTRVYAHTKTVSSVPARACEDGSRPKTYRPSPNGAWFLCARFLNLLLVEGAAPHRVHVMVSSFLENAGGTSFGWLDDERFLATVDDPACPRANLYDYFPTRVALFNRTKGRLANGPCAFGVVVGRKRIALIGEAPNSIIRDVMIVFSDDSRYCCDGYDKHHHTWSLDLGRTWHDGYPLGFDRADRLRYRDAFSDRILNE